MNRAWRRRKIQAQPPGGRAGTVDRGTLMLARLAMVLGMLAGVACVAFGQEKPDEQFWRIANPTTDLDAEGIEAAIHRLGAAEHEDRSAAFNMLLDTGPAAL